MIGTPKVFCGSDDASPRELEFSSVTRELIRIVIVMTHLHRSLIPFFSSSVSVLLFVSCGETNSTTSRGHEDAVSEIPRSEQANSDLSIASIPFNPAGPITETFPSWSGPFRESFFPKSPLALLTEVM